MMARPQTEAQLRTYAERFEGGHTPALLAVAECSGAYAQPRLPAQVDGVPVYYVAWSDIAALVIVVADSAKSLAEKRLLREFVRYLKGLMTMQNVTSNLT